MRRWICVLVGVLAGCGPASLSDAVESARQPIIGGTLSVDDAQVFALGDGAPFCTATLIGDRTLLTAAHCLDQTTPIAASNRTDVKGWPSDAIPVVDKRVHPKWEGGDTDWDVGLVLLQRAPDGVSPKAWNRVPLTMTMVPEVRALGFGETHTTGGSGVRYQAMVRVTGLSPNVLYIGADGESSTCFGDSGGPSMHQGTDGVERVVGVHSFANSAACNGGGDVRVDAIAEFIDQWTREKAPTCATDGACVANCPQPDLDCFCGTDGSCDARCPLPDTDKDCPKNCLKDGVCAFGSCGVKDPDCNEDGEPCSSAENCSGHQCLSDAQRESSYCSRSCHANTDCGGGMRCSFGVCRYPVLPLATMGESCVIGQTHCSGGVCGGQSESTATCRPACGPSGACPGAMKCVGGALGVSYCQGTVMLEATPTERPAAKSCSATGAGLSLGLVIVLLARLRRRRASR